MKRAIAAAILSLLVTGLYADPPAQARFVLTDAPDARYLLDSKTGRMWFVGVDTNKTRALCPVPYYREHGLATYLPASEEHDAAVDKLALAQQFKRVGSVTNVAAAVVRPHPRP